MTRDAMLRIDRGREAAFATAGKYTDNLADLVVADKVLATELTVPLTIDLDVGASGKSYVVTRLQRRAQRRRGRGRARRSSRAAAAW